MIILLRYRDRRCSRAAKNQSLTVSDTPLRAPN